MSVGSPAHPSCPSFCTLQTGQPLAEGLLSSFALTEHIPQQTEIPSPQKWAPHVDEEVSADSSFMRVQAEYTHTHISKD